MSEGGDDVPDDEALDVQPDELWVEVKAMTPRIAGIVHHTAGSDVSFDGWIELMGVLEVGDSAAGAS